MNFNYIERPHWSNEFDRNYKHYLKLALTGAPLAHSWNEERKNFLRSKNRDIQCAYFPVESSSCVTRLQKIKGRIAPLLELHPILFKEIKLSADQTLREMFAGSSISATVNSFLDQAAYSPSDFRYRTEPPYTIVGHNSNDVRSLAGIAHELGHCLYETESVTQSSEFASELFAVLFETLTVESILSGTKSLEEWKEYQMERDQFNFMMANFEWAESRGQEDFDPVFDPALLLLRDTLFAKPGYQQFYAEASVRKNIILKRLEGRYV